MFTRRHLLSLPLAALLPAAAHAQAAPHARGATALTRVFGDGQKLTAVALEFPAPLDTRRLTPDAFTVAGRRVARVYANTGPAQAAEGHDGRFAIVELAPDDAEALLFRQAGRTTERRAAAATVTQTRPILGDDGASYAATGPIATSAVRNAIVDSFQQREFRDPANGNLLRYNIFVPEGHDGRTPLPLVLFMHDAGTTSAVTDTTLVQGLGAVVWASPEDQAKRPAIVLAPQYDRQIVNDASEATSDLETTVALIEAVSRQYAIDRDRIYATGQSGGAMMTIAINIRFPDLFAASFLVAGQWDPAKVAPMASDKLWIIVSEGDLKAYPGQNAITAELERLGAKVSRAVWDGRADAAGFDDAVRAMERDGAPINYVALKRGTVVPEGQVDNGGGNHVNTWRIAYTIEGVRDWLFRQRR